MADHLEKPSRMDDNLHLSFEEFRLYYESTEKVTDRRIETNRSNYSVCAATLVAIAVIANWSFKDSGLFLIGVVSICVLSAMATLFCLHWVMQIRDFKNLNNAKFTVLNNMAPQLVFDATNPGRIKSYCPFQREWEALEETRALKKWSASRILVLKSSRMEYFVPQAFLALFLGILVFMIVIAIALPPASASSAAQISKAADSPSK